MDRRGAEGELGLVQDLADWRVYESMGLFQMEAFYGQESVFTFPKLGLTQAGFYFRASSAESPAPFLGAGVVYIYMVRASQPAAQASFQTLKSVRFFDVSFQGLPPFCQANVEVDPIRIVCLPQFEQLFEERSYKVKVKVKRRMPAHMTSPEVDFSLLIDAKNTFISTQQTEIESAVNKGVQIISFIPLSFSSEGIFTI